VRVTPVLVPRFHFYRGVSGKPVRTWRSLKGNRCVLDFTFQQETNVSNLFIAGELGGLALIKNAINQGRDCVDTVTGRINGRHGGSSSGVLDLLIVGAGPAGISASLRAMERKLSYLTIEQDEVGGTVAKYPRQKLVMTSPVELPLYGKFKKMELSKEELIALWKSLLARADFNVRTGEKVEDIQKGADGIFTIVSNKAQYRARCNSRPGPLRHSAQAGRQRRGTAQSDVSAY